MLRRYEFYEPLFKAISGGILDTSNTYYSQVRLNLECAFSTLIHRWGYLYKSIPNNISITKASPLVIFLCILHNFYFDTRLGERHRETRNCI